MIKETHKFKVSLINSNYYLLEIKTNAEIEIEDLQQLIEFEKELSGKTLPVLVICLPGTTTNSDVISYMSKNKNNPYCSAAAYVINSLAQKILANVYTKLNKPERPVKFFNNNEEALQWLQQFMYKSNVKLNEVEAP